MQGAWVALMYHAGRCVLHSCRQTTWRAIAAWWQLAHARADYRIAWATDEHWASTYVRAPRRQRAVWQQSETHAIMPWLMRGAV